MFTHIVFFAPSEVTAMLILKCLFMVALIEMAILLFGLIEFCALVVKKNGQIGKLNRRFAVHCLRYQSLYQLRVGLLLKVNIDKF